jgi:hypothetical protein
MMNQTTGRPVFSLRGEESLFWLFYPLVLTFALVMPVAVLLVPVFIYFVQDAVFRRPAVWNQLFIWRFIPIAPFGRAPPSYR